MDIRTEDNASSAVPAGRHGVRTQARLSSRLNSKAQILAAYHERVSLRGLSRVFGVPRNAISAWLKKSQSVAAPQEDTGQSQQA